MFNEYGGFELLCKLFGMHKDLSIAKAIAHIIELRCNDYCNTYSFYLFIYLLVFNDSNKMEEIENIISEILFEKSLDEETAEGFLEFLIDLRKRKIGVSENIKLFKATLAVANRFIKNRELCQKALMFLSFDITHKIGNLNLYSTQLLFILSIYSQGTLRRRCNEDSEKGYGRVSNR